MIFLQDSVDKFISQLTLITYQTGSLGTFFLNLLMADHPLYDDMVRTGLFGRDRSTEWRGFSYNHGLLDPHQINARLAAFPDVDSFAELLYAQKLIYNHRVHDQFDEKKKFSFFDVNDELTQNDIPTDKIIVPYIKNHYYHDGGGTEAVETYKNLKVKQKLHCCFPYLKQWIPYVLAVHKHAVVFRTPRSWESGVFANNLIKPNPFFKICPFDDTGFTNIDMYQLVLNSARIDDTVKMLEEQILDFKFSDKKLNLVHTVKSDIISTLADYNLTPDMDFDLNNDFQTFAQACDKLVYTLRQKWQNT